MGETATLELTPQQAEIITVAQQMADRLTLALRSVADAQEKPTTRPTIWSPATDRRGTVRADQIGRSFRSGSEEMNSVQ